MAMREMSVCDSQKKADDHKKVSETVGLAESYHIIMALRIFMGNGLYPNDRIYTFSLR